MRHRIFIAINLPEDIKKELLNYQAKWPELPVRWTREDNLHITLIFIGYASDQDIGGVCKVTKEVVSRYSAFSVNLNKVCYGPPKKMPPRMVWVEGEKIKELADLKNDLERALVDAGVHFETENREFKPHITLGRIKTWEWKKIEPEERPEINEEISLSFEVKTIEVMESQLKRGGAEYMVLESVPLMI